MILSDLLGSDALEADGRRVGAVVDVRLEISGAPAQLLAATVVTGVLVSPRKPLLDVGVRAAGRDGAARSSHGSSDGCIAACSSSAWDDVELVDEGRVVFRGGYERRDPMLPPAPRT